MKDLLIKLCEFIFGEGFFSGISPFLSQNMLTDDVFVKLWDIVYVLTEDIISPIAVYLLVISLMISLFDKIALSQSSTEQKIKLFMYFVVGSFLISRSTYILQSIIAISNSFLISIVGGVELYSPGMTGQEAYEALFESGGGFVGDIGKAILLAGIALVVLTTNLVISVVFYTRIYYIFIKSVVAPLVFSSFAFGERNHATTNFIKEFIGLCIQPLIIYLTVLITSILMAAHLGVNATNLTFANFVWPYVAYALTTIVLVLKSEQTSKTLFG